MKCPRFGSPILVERERDGVMIDVGQECRGVWLDRGELEKLIVRTQREFEEYEHSYDSRSDDDLPRRSSQNDERRFEKPRKKKKESGVESLGDIFGG